jgi:hypothetical protein
LTPDEFRRQVAKVVVQLQADGGIAKHQRQKRAVGLRTWVDRQTGMIRLSGEFEPHSGVELVKQRDDRVDVLFRDATPPLCPADSLARQAFLRAHALLDLIKGGGAPAFQNRSWSGRATSGSLAG